MATDKNTIKNWFKTGLKPIQAQFYAWMDSYWHKDEKIPITAIDDIEAILNDKADREALDNLVNAMALAKIYAIGELQIFKAPESTNNEILETGDYCIGFVEGQFINANYIGGDKTLLASFEI